MKNLLPINLSESSIDYAYGLVEAISKAKEGSKDMDLEKLNEKLGLPKETSIEDAFKALTEKLNPAAPPKDPTIPTVPKPNISDDLKRLAEDNPNVKGLIELIDAQNETLRAFQSGLLEADISKKLAEFDNSKIVLTPRAKDMVHDLLLDMPVALHEKLWDVLNLLRNNSGLMVELGERAGANPRFGRSKDSVTLFMDEVNKYVTDNSTKEKPVSFDEAMTAVSRNSPELWDGYRQGTYAFKD
jgi:hypothetical protein